MPAQELKPPTPPSLDRSDPAVMRRAAGIAKRRMNEERKKIEKSLPLFAPHIPIKEVTAEDVMDQREEFQAEAWIRGSERDIARVLKVTALKNQVYSLVEEAEYVRLYEGLSNWSFAEDSYWYIKLRKIKERAEPIPDTAMMVYAWLETWEGEAPTYFEIHQSKGDGLTAKEILDALLLLERRELAKGGLLKVCSVTGKWSARWSIT